MDPARARHSVPSRNLIVALDIGTTFSGAACAFLDPGHVPQIRYVTWHPSSSNPESAKVLSVLYYDHNGVFRGVQKGIDFQDSDALVRVKWLKLLLSPLDPPAVMTDQMSTELPKGKAIIDVFADFMRYLFDSVRALFKSPEHNGELGWESISKSIELVLTHPNGWGDPQQTHLRNAAVKAGIVPDTPAGRSRVHFVTEGEASFSFCVTHTREGKNVKPREQALIINAGGGTIDISTYKILSNGPLRAEELYEPKCLVQGAELVTARATAMVREKWRDSRFDNPKDLETFSQKFDEGLKQVFSVSNSRADQYVKLGSSKDNDPSCGISRGKLTFTGAEVSGFFEPSIQSTVDAIRDDFKQRLPTNSFAFLIGGFATSPWLSEQLQRRLSDLGFRFCKPDVHASNAVAIGAITYYIDHFVTGGKEERKEDREKAEQREIRDPKALVAKQKADILRLEQKLIGECKYRDNQIARLEQENAKLRGSLREMEVHARQAQSMQERFKQTQELLDVRTAELSGAQTFLSTADRLSETEVLGIVRSLNENIFQLAVSLTDAWEKLESSQATSRIKLDLTSKARVPILFQLARGRDLTGLTYLLQSRLCYQAVKMTSSWVRNQESGGLGSVYRHLSASEVQAISAKWRSLTHSHLSPPPPQSALLMEELAGLLVETGSFPSPEKSLKFVKTVALEGIEAMIQTAQRLETAFMVDVTSSDMSLVYESPDTPFDEAKMINEFGSKSASKSGKRDRIAGTTEVGVEKRICGQGKTGRAETLLKAKVVLEKDVVGDGK